MRRSAARRRRLVQLGGALVGAILIVAVLVAVSSSGGPARKGVAKGVQANQNVAAVSSLLSGIPQSGNSLGSPTAPVTMQYFGDLQCPVCQAFTLDSLPQVIAKDVRPGTLKIQYRSLQTATPDAPTFREQQAAALAAGRQNLMWNYIELFYREQGQEGSNYVTPDYLAGLARQTPALNAADWSTIRTSPVLSNQVAGDEDAAAAAGLDSTPSLIVTGKHGTKTLVGDATSADIVQAIQTVR